MYVDLVNQVPDTSPEEVNPYKRKKARSTRHTGRGDKGSIQTQLVQDNKDLRLKIKMLEDYIQACAVDKENQPS